jgi:DNA-binding NarL/FixJ family response regulator
MQPRWPLEAAEAAAALSPRQRATLRGLLAGLSEKEVAHRLGISRHTLHEHVCAIYERLGVDSRAQLLARFIPPDALPG